MVVTWFAEGRYPDCQERVRGTVGARMVPLILSRSRDMRWHRLDVPKIKTTKEHVSLRWPSQVSITYRLDRSQRNDYIFS
jgi:hypothetical protein